MVMYAAIFFSGAIALTFQVVWQKYLSFLVGSEARSISLVVAVFLLGLAAGYRFWGNVTERSLSRRTILKLVGYIELGIAGYAIIFASLFAVVRNMSYAAPDWLVVDLAMTALLLFIPTFLMGASIPLLTAAIPHHVDEVNYCHSRVYGINTLGACVGAMVGGFYMLPTFGLPMSLLIGAACNIVVAMVFLANRVDGPMHKAQTMPSIPNQFGAGGIYLFVFVTGAVSIASEVLFIRIVGLSIGSGHYVFPMVLGVVILGLAIGSLSLRRSGVTSQRVFTELLTLSALLTVVYFTIPHWPYWLSHVRVSLVSIPSNYVVYHTAVVVFLMLILLPVVIPMGRLLPIGYALISKTASDYGMMCGRVYFINTIGTVIGAVGLGYTMFHLFELPMIFKINIMLVLILTAYLYMKHQHHRAAAVCAVLAAVALVLPSWNRSHHEFGIFRNTMVQPYHFSGVFSLPSLFEGQTLYFGDDPSATVTVTETPVLHEATGQPLPSRSIIVNGKSDGNTISDYSNMVLTGLLPYLHAPADSQLDAVVVGLGTGMTSGAVSIGEDVRSVTTLEISSGVIDAFDHFEEASFKLQQSGKSTIVKTDAFRFFARTQQTFDLIVSEPSNPWVVGTENLFTADFYQLASRVMNDGAMLFQWVHIYEMSDEVFLGIVRNIADEFGHVAMFKIGLGDVGILASHHPIQETHMQRRLAEPAVREALQPMVLDGESPIRLLRRYHDRELRAIALNSFQPPHSLDFPWLGHRAGLARFLGRMVDIDRLLAPEIARHVAVADQWHADALQWLHEQYDHWQPRCVNPTGHSTMFVCAEVVSLYEHQQQLAEPVTLESAAEHLEAYRELRSRQFVEPNLPLLHTLRDQLLADGSSMRVEARRRIAALLAREYAYEWHWQTAADFVSACRAQGILSDDEFELLRLDLRMIREYTQTLVQSLDEMGLR